MKVEGITNKILIADDTRTNLMFLKKGVAKLPYEFTFVESGTEALEKVMGEDFDLLILDVVMPGLSGFEVITTFKKERPDRKIPFIFLTGQSESESIKEGFTLGAVDYITKPFSLIELKLRIRTHHSLYATRLELDTYAKNMEALAEERAEQLVHADRLASLGTMSAVMMHEINNPTTFISGNIQLMQDKFYPIIRRILKASPEANDYKVKFILDEVPEIFKGISSGVKRIKKITDGLKAFSKSSSSKENHFPVDLRSCVENALQFTKPTISEAISINYEKPTDEHTCLIEPHEMEQVMINLMVNSSHAIEKIDSPQIYIKLLKSKDQIICRIGDNGKGIPPKILEKIWQPFFTTKPFGKGTGLGLAICKRIIQGYKGELEYTGKENEGAEFTISLKAH